MSKWFYSQHRLRTDPTVLVGCIIDDSSDYVIAEVYELEGVNNGPLMARAPELLEQRDELLTSLKEMKEAAAACFRVILDGGLMNDLALELRKAGVDNGFGLRANTAIAKAEATNVR